MVADDPFHEPPDTRCTAPATPILRVHSDARLSELAHVDLGDPTHGDPVPATSLSLPASSGTRTPRRVQWTADHVVNLAPVATHTSEQSGVSADNLSSVNIALERFASHRTAPTGLSGVSLASMGSSMGEGEDYDYRLDDAPMPPSDDDERTEERILDSGVNDQVTSYVPPGETDGLPSAPDAPAAEMQQAANLVRSHTRKWGLLRRRGTTAGGTMRRKDTHRQTDNHQHERRVSADSQTPLHGEAVPRVNPPINPPLNGPPGGMPPIAGGTSVLSSLLALYNQQQMQSGHSTPGSSRPPSTAGSIEDDSEQHGPAKKSSSLPWKRRSRLSQDSSPASPGFGEHKRSKSETSIADRDYNEPSPGLLGSFQKAVDAWRDNDRPKTARSGAGVFGALVQSSGAIGAAAVPSSATLMPAAKKHGYHLNRYTLGEKRGSASESPRSASWHLQHSPDPQQQQRPDSSYSVSTVVEGMTETLEPESLPRNKSFDNVLTMKRKPKRPTPLHLKSFERLPGLGIRSARTTPDEKNGSGYFEVEDERRRADDQRRREWEAEKKRRKKEKEKKKKQEIFIIQHVAAVIARQQFILKLARALMMFGSPSHRLETQIQATAKVLEINAQVVYLPNTMLVSFGDDATHTSETKFLKQVTGLDLGKLLATHNIYWDVVHDRVSVEDASRELDSLMTTPPIYNTWQTILIGGLCSVFISIPSFYGSFIDALMCFVLGAFLVAVQIVAARNDMLNNVFEITVATLISFVAAVLASTHYFCYTALVSGGVVLILPGYIVLTGALELASRNITAGAVRIGYSVIYSLFLGFGISIGAEVYFKIRRVGVLNADDYTCGNTHYAGAPWYMSKPSGYWCMWRAWTKAKLTFQTTSAFPPTLASCP